MEIKIDLHTVLLVRDLYSQNVAINRIMKLTGLSQTSVHKIINITDFPIEMEHPRHGRYAIEDEVFFEAQRLYKRNRYLPRQKRLTREQIYRAVCEKFPDKNILRRGFLVRMDRLQKITPLSKFSEKNALLTLLHEPGEMQVDFGFFDFVENGTKFMGSFLVVAFAYSNAVYVQISHTKTTENLIDGLKNIFAHIGFVPKLLVCDNDCALVNLKHPNDEMPYKTYREVVSKFSAFKSECGFELRLCSPAAPQQKGVVERMVAFARKRLFVPIPSFKDINQYNAQLLSLCDSVLNDRIHYRKNKHKLELFHIVHHVPSNRKDHLFVVGMP